jgi:hypothetical protein
MDEQLRRLAATFEPGRGPARSLVVGDHGEARRARSSSSNLLYQATMAVPLLLVGPGAEPRVSDTPVSARRVFHTILDWAGIERADSLRDSGKGKGEGEEIVLAEAMKPYLAYGWQPQVMAVSGGRKAIFAGKLEVYDVAADPAESATSRIEDFPGPPRWRWECRCRRSGSAVASKLGGRSCASSPRLPERARPVIFGRPAPAGMTRLFELFEGVRLFEAKRYAKMIRSGEDPGRGSEQPRRGPAAGDSALGAGTRGPGGPGVREGEPARAGLTRRPDLPGPSLCSRQGLGTRGAASREDRGGDAGSTPRCRGACGHSGEAGKDPRSHRPEAEDL